MLIYFLSFFRNHDFNPQVRDKVVAFVLLLLLILPINILERMPEPDPYGLVSTRKYARLDGSTEAGLGISHNHLNAYNELTSLEMLEEFYQARDYNLAWFTDGKLNDQAYELIKELSQAWMVGISTGSFIIDQVRAELHDHQQLWDRGMVFHARCVQLDIHLSNMYLKYAEDLALGQVNPSNMKIIKWETIPDQINFVAHLEEALKINNIEASLNDLEPKKKQYAQLELALNKLQKVKLKGGWPLPGPMPALTKNDTSPHVRDMKIYLQQAGYLTVDKRSYLKSFVFDAKLEAAVREFQKFHGLKTDGKVGKQTIKEMNKPVDYRIDQIKVNLERLRWSPENFGDQYILVNIPEYEMKYFQKGELKLQMKIVVGKIEDNTPVLKDTLEYIVFNPKWKVPYSIASEEMLPKIKNDPAFLERNDYVLLRNSYKGDTVDPFKVDWADISKDNFPYFIVEHSGPTNALGRIKFLFPNNQSIYLHDTPADHLFNMRQRDYSHGCVRIEKPFTLAKMLLEGQMPAEEIQAMLAKNETHYTRLHKKVLVHFIYQTVRVDKEGRVYYLQDLYNLDKNTAPFLDNE